MAETRNKILKQAGDFAFNEIKNFLEKNYQGCQQELIALHKIAIKVEWNNEPIILTFEVGVNKNKEIEEMYEYKKYKDWLKQKSKRKVGR